jgi:hypothetical protein
MGEFVCFFYLCDWLAVVELFGYGLSIRKVGRGASVRCDLPHPLPSHRLSGTCQSSLCQHQA